MTLHVSCMREEPLLVKLIQVYLGTVCTYHIINTFRKLDNYQIRLLKIHKPQESNTATRDLDMFSRFWFIIYSQLNNESRPAAVRV